MNKEPQTTIIASLPSCGAACACDRDDCPAPRFDLCFRLGRGFAPYEFCAICDQIVSQSAEAEWLNISTTKHD